jgi:S1-C subfamily serine protease
MPSIVIRHLSGTKANQVEEIPLQGFREVLIGRESNAQIRFDADREDLVSRNHARIVRDPADPNGFLITDLDSRNGTFINRHRIYGASRLQHGDRVQLGPSGPEFVFEVSPPPAAPPTRLAETVPPTRLAEQGPARPTADAVGVGAMGGGAMPPGMVPDAPRPVGRATVERLVGEATSQMKGESRKTMWIAAIGILVVLIAGSAYFVWSRQQQAARDLQAVKDRIQWEEAARKADDAARELRDRQDKIQQQLAIALASKSPQARQALPDLVVQAQAVEHEIKVAEAGRAEALRHLAPREVDKLPAPAEAPSGSVPLTPEQIHAANVKSVILIEATWKVTDTDTGGQIYLYHHPNDMGACPQVSKSEYLPVFVDDGGTVSPVLSTLPNGGNNTPIVGTHSGTGFLVSGDGFFVTNRHVLAPWRANWNTASFTRKAWGIKIKNNSIVGCLSTAEFPSEWVPSEGSKMVVDKIENMANAETGVETTSTYSDRLKYNPLKTSVQGEAIFNVTFAKTTQRYRATSVTLSERHDVALGKVDVPSAQRPVVMFNDENSINPGQMVVVLGYPAVSPDVFAMDVSRDMFTNRAHLSAIADPTLTTGPISKVLPSGNAIRGVDGYISSGEVYQLGINTTGAGNSGGPVFDSKGRVIAIFYAGRSAGGASATFAVPIKFGRELIDNKPVIQ